MFEIWEECKTRGIARTIVEGGPGGDQHIAEWVGTLGVLSGVWRGAKLPNSKALITLRVNLF